MDRFVAEFSTIGRQPLDYNGRSRLAALIEESGKRLALLRYMSPLSV